MWHKLCNIKVDGVHECEKEKGSTPLIFFLFPYSTITTPIHIRYASQRMYIAAYRHCLHFSCIVYAMAEIFYSIGASPYS